MSSSTTSPAGKGGKNLPPLPGPGRGHKKDAKATRRLTRELANKQLQQSFVEAISGGVKELVRTANSNPVVGLGLGVITVDILFRTGVLSYTAAAAFYGFTGATVAADVIGSIAGIIPFSHANAENPLKPTADTLYYGSENPAGPPADKARRYAPE